MPPVLSRGLRALPCSGCNPLQVLDLPFDPDYDRAGMRHEIVLTPEAVQDLRGLDAYDRATICDALEAHLRHEPNKASRSRIMRLRDLVSPRYRLRIG